MLQLEPILVYLTGQKGLCRYDSSPGVFQDFPGPNLITWALKSRGLSWVGRQRGDEAGGSQRFSEGLNLPLVALKMGKEHQEQGLRWLPGAPGPGDPQPRRAREQTLDPTSNRAR